MFEPGWINRLFGRSDKICGLCLVCGSFIRAGEFIPVTSFHNCEGNRKYLKSAEPTTPDEYLSRMDSSVEFAERQPGWMHGTPENKRSDK